LFSLERSRLDLFELEARAQLRQRGLADDDLPRRRARAEPRARVRGVADGGVRERLRAADIPDDARPRVDPEAYREGRLADPDAFAIEPPEDLHLLERALHAAYGVVPVDHGGAPERHDPVAHELVERALVLEERLDHELEVLVEHLDQRLGRGALAHRGEAANVAVVDGQLLDQLPALLHLELPRDHLLRDVRRDEALEAVANDDLLLDLLREDRVLDEHRGLTRDRRDELEIRFRIIDLPFDAAKSIDASWVMTPMRSAIAWFKIVELTWMAVVDPSRRRAALALSVPSFSRSMMTPRSALVNLKSARRILSSKTSSSRSRPISRVSSQVMRRRSQ